MSSAVPTIPIYSRPNHIENKNLLLEGNCMLLKPNLMEHHDYVCVSSEVWKYLYSWYSCDWSIVRYLKRNKSNDTIYLDLYPGQSDDGEGGLT